MPLIERPAQEAVSAWHDLRVDVEAYLARIGYSGDRLPSVHTLRALHRAHLSAIPFENLDIQLGLPILLDLRSLEAKLVGARRGGYCFEQNALFAAVLDELGFAVTRLGARVRLGSADIRARTHMLLVVELDGTSWLADVGFGAPGILEPIPAAPGELVDQNGWQFRVVAEGPAFVLRSFFRGAWADLYSFTLEAEHSADFELGNYYVSTHPESRFVTNLIAQRITPDLRLVLDRAELVEIRSDGSSATPVESDDALLEILAERFGLEFPAGTRFRDLAG